MGIIKAAAAFWRCFSQTIGKQEPPHELRVRRIGRLGLHQPHLQSFASAEVGVQLVRKVNDEFKSAAKHKAANFLTCFYSFLLDSEWAKRTLTGSSKLPAKVLNNFRTECSTCSGHAKEAVELFEKAIAVQDELPQFHNVIRWDLCWCHAIAGDWAKAAETARYLQENCKYACFLQMQVDEQGRDDLRPEVDKAMLMVPTLRVRYAGKTLPNEKFAITMAE
ncbi:hypothetical protein U1Q18_052294, partial [Sarracenia purpurea var. burkii]